ncbi:MAG: hypothetical protein KU37_03005 [Sulfuricurvum sp. PC08-66]|nr:MAG: hypothetical protein KU37_03005 [Sulfuricurvum sp. PC08-66]
MLVSLLVMGAQGYAQTLQDALQNAKQLFDAKAYARAYEAFYLLFEAHSDNARINYYLGLSAIALHKYEEAIAAMERVLIKEPTYTQARLQLGQLYYLTGVYDQAKQELTSVLEDTKLDAKSREAVEALLVRIDQKKRRHFWHLGASAGLLYDSNIHNDVGATVYLVLPEVLAGGITGSAPRADILDQESLSVAHRYTLTPNLAWQNSLMGFGQFYKATPTKNILYGLGTTGVAWQAGVWESALQLTYERVGMGGEELLSAGGLKVALGLRLFEGVRLGAQLLGQRKAYAPSYTYMDATVWDATGSLDAVWGNRAWHWGIVGNAALEEAPHSPIMDRKWATLKSTIDWQVLGALRFSPMASYRYTSYVQSMLDATFTLRPRKDYQLNAQATLEWSIGEALALSLTSAYVRNYSTHTAYDYSKWMTGVSARVAVGF